MRYIKISTYDYQDNPNEGTLYLGIDKNKNFIHQVIEDTEMGSDISLEEAVSQTNADTSAFAAEQGFEISFGECKQLYIDNIKFILCPQEMTFPDGRWAVQMNSYFFDPKDNVFRMSQFGTLPITSEEAEQYSDKCRDYVSKCMKRLTADMALPEGIFSFNIPAFKV